MVKAVPLKPWPLLLALAMPVLLTGCFAMEKDLDPIRSDVAILEKQFVDMQRDVSEVKRRVEDGQEAPQRANVDNQARLAALEKRMDALEAKVREQGQAQPAPAPQPMAPESVGPEPVEITPLEEAPKAPEPAPKSDEQSFKESMKALETGDYKKAEAGFTDFLAKYPASDKVTDALYYMGVAYEKMGQTDKARETFTRLMDNYPYSDAAKMARPRLANKQ